MEGKRGRIIKGKHTHCKTISFYIVFCSVPLNPATAALNSMSFTFYSYFILFSILSLLTSLNSAVSFLLSYWCLLYSLIISDWSINTPKLRTSTNQHILFATKTQFHVSINVRKLSFVERHSQLVSIVILLSINTVFVRLYCLHTNVSWDRSSSAST